MAKCDKELTAEIVTAYIENWNSTAFTLQPDSVQNLIEAVFSTISNLKCDHPHNHCDCDAHKG
ncbi:hypothetical protein [Erysipelothrix anatis]|uniref:hypothetical protein n=1 Tax=Erysipelothrix anatis TaxID=2683713 RepID=UPI001358A356|nr:hypothetical protein [Erysipelothrix anatis]